MLKIGEAFLYKVNKETEEMGERREGPKIKKRARDADNQDYRHHGKLLFQGLSFQKNNRPHYVSFILAYSKWKIHMQRDNFHNFLPEKR